MRGRHPEGRRRRGAPRRPGPLALASPFARAVPLALALPLARACLLAAFAAGFASADGGATPFWERSREEIDAEIARWQELPDFSSRVRAILLARVGTPYVLGCLGEGAGAAPDSDAVFRLDQVDCTVFVLTTAALAHARSLEEAERNIVFANYREVDGTRPVSYEARLHFTTDRLDASPYFRNVTDQVVPVDLLATRKLTLNVKDNGEPLLPIHWKRPIVLRYLPAASATADLVASLPPVTGVAFVRESFFAKGLEVAHEGVILDGRDLVHASSEAERVVRVPFLEYLRKPGGGFRFDGLVFYEFR
jgi:hypothetical protein